MMPCPSSGTSFSPESYLFPPVARSLMWRAVIPSSLHLWATSWAANMAAYGEDSSRSAFTFIPPVTRQMVSLGTKAQDPLFLTHRGFRVHYHTLKIESSTAQEGQRMKVNLNIILIPQDCPRLGSEGVHRSQINTASTFYS